MTAATVVRPNAATADFACQAADGCQVAGWDFFLQKPSATSGLFVCAAKGAGWRLAPYILRSASNLLNQVLAPQVEGTLVEPANPPVKVGGRTYTLPNGNGQAVQTAYGIAWIWQPSFVGRSPSKSANIIPTGPYAIAIAQPAKGRIGLAHLLETFPWVRAADADNVADTGTNGG